MGSRSWAFTLFNYNEEMEKFFGIWPDYSYLIYGREICPRTGKRHLQGFFTLKKTARFSYLKKVLPQGTHFEPSHKPALANVRYCVKEGDYVIYDRRHQRSGSPQIHRSADPSKSSFVTNPSLRVAGLHSNPLARLPKSHIPNLPI